MRHDFSFLLLIELHIRNSLIRANHFSSLSCSCLSYYYCISNLMIELPAKRYRYKILLSRLMNRAKIQRPSRL